MDVFDLMAKLSLDSSEYEAGLGGAEKQAQGFGSKVKSFLGTAGKVGAAALTAVATGTAAVSKAFISGASDVASYGDNIDKMSQKMGLSAEAYQEWDAIMQHSGTSIESMQASMKTLANAVENGNEAFQRLGMSQEEIAGMSQEDLFAATISALQNVDNETERTYLAGQLLGRGATELGALLNTSAEDTEAMRKRVHELGGVMSDEAVKAAAKYQDSLQDMQTSFSGLQRNLLSEFLPGITTTMDGLTEIFSGNSNKGLGLITSGIRSLVTKLTEEIPKFAEVAVGIVEALGTAILDNLPMLITAASSIVLQISQFVIENLPTIIDAAVEIIFAISDGIIQAIPDLLPAIVEVIMKIVERLTDPDMILRLVDAAFQIMGALAMGLINAIPKVIAAVPRIISNLVQTLIKAGPQLLESGKTLVLKLKDGISAKADEIREKFHNMVTSIRDTINEAIQGALHWGRDLIQNFINGIVAAAQHLWQTLTNIAQGVRNFLGFSEPKEGPLSNFHTYAPDMMKLFAKGIKDNEDMLYSTVEDAFDFGKVTVDSASSFNQGGASWEAQPITIIVQSILDGKILCESVTKYQRDNVRAYG